MKSAQDMTQKEMLTSLFVIWGMNEIATNNPQSFITEDEDDMISKIIHYRTKHLDVKIPTELGYIISLCSNGNPGISIIMYHTILRKVSESKGKLPRGYTIKTEDFSLTFPESFPDSSDPVWGEKLQKMWDDQKDDIGNNKVDTYKFWDDLFEEE